MVLSNMSCTSARREPSAETSVLVRSLPADVRRSSTILATSQPSGSCLTCLYFATAGSNSGTSTACSRRAATRAPFSRAGSPEAVASRKFRPAVRRAALRMAAGILSCSTPLASQESNSMSTRPSSHLVSASSVCCSSLSRSLAQERLAASRPPPRSCSAPAARAARLRRSAGALRSKPRPRCRCWRPSSRPAGGPSGCPRPPRAASASGRGPRAHGSC
mmetsp:Transcript_83647/g.259775  ORF Transcript_83647/g.259775 Transcript_83647/m.259775 type:complete len:219 (-) Transcript_83647:331-987(-)